MPVTETGSATCTYPEPLQDALRADPGGWWDGGEFRDCFSPQLDEFPFTSDPPTSGYSIVAHANSLNCVPGDWTVFGTYGGAFLNGGITSQITGQAASYYKWDYEDGDGFSIAPPAGSKPPDHTDFLVMASLGCGASAWYGNTGLTSGLRAHANVSDSLGDMTTADPASPNTSSYSLHLLRKSTGVGGVVSVEVSTTANTSSDNRVPYDYQSASETFAVAGAGAVYYLQSDSREVTLTRDGATPNPAGPIYSPDGYPHGEYVDADGTGHGETVYSYFEFDPSAGGPPLQAHDEGNWLTFTSNFRGGWSRKTTTDFFGVPTTDYDVNWQWYPSASQDTMHSGQWKMPYGGVDRVDGDWTGTPTPSTPGYITYTATDNQNPATATATYDITVHEPWDNKRPANPAVTLNEDFFYGPVVQNSTGVDSTIPPTSATAITASVTLGLKLTANFEPSWAKTWGIEFNGAATAGVTETVTVPGTPLKAGYEQAPYIEIDHYTK